MTSSTPKTPKGAPDDDAPRFGAWRAHLVRLEGKALQMQRSRSFTERAVGSIVLGLVLWLAAWALGEAWLLDHDREP